MWCICLSTIKVLRVLLPPYRRVVLQPSYYCRGAGSKNLEHFLFSFLSFLVPFPSIRRLNAYRNIKILGHIAPPLICSASEHLLVSFSRSDCSNFQVHAFVPRTTVRSHRAIICFCFDDNNNKTTIYKAP